MRTTRNMIGTVVLLAALALSMGIARAAEPDVPKPIELPQQATEAEPGKEIEHKFEQKGDVLWLRVKVEKAGALYYVGHCIGQEGDWIETSVALFDAKGVRVGTGDVKWIKSQGFTKWRIQQFWHTPVQPGAYHLRVTCTKTNGFGWAILVGTEPADGDDKPATARPVESGKPVKLRLLPAGDVDHFRFEVKERGYALVTRTAGQQTVFKLRYALVDAAGKALTAHDEPSATKEQHGETFWAARVRPGAYTLAVRSPEPFPDEVELRLDVLKELDPYEPNDEPAQAMPVPVNRPMTIRLLPAGDVDWLRFSLDHDGVLAIFQPWGRDTKVQFKLELRDGKGEKEIPLSTLWSNWPGNDTWRAARLKKGDYMVGVSGPPSAEERGITLEFERERDLCEPNDDPSQATAVPGIFDIRPYPYGDVEWFAFEATEPSILTINFLHAGLWKHFDTEIHVEGKKPYSPDLYYCQPRSGSGECDYVARVIVPAGKHKIKMSLNGARKEVQAVDFDLIPNDALDPYEPNDVREQAHPITFGETMKFRLIWRDLDWFYFEAPEDGYVTFRFTKTPWPVDPHIMLHTEQDEKPIHVNWHQWQGGMAGTLRNFQRAMPVKKGRVDVKIFDTANGVGNDFVEMEMRFHPKIEAQDTNFYIVGFQTDASASEQLEAIAGVAGGWHKITMEPTYLPELLTQTVEAAAARRAPAAPEEPEAQKPKLAARTLRSRPARWLILAAIVLGGILMLFMFKKRKKEGQGGPDGKA